MVQNIPEAGPAKKQGNRSIMKSNRVKSSQDCTSY